MNEIKSTRRTTLSISASKNFVNEHKERNDAMEIPFFTSQKVYSDNDSHYVRTLKKAPN